MSFSIDRVLEDFPGATQEIAGKRLVYLDSAASSLKPKPVVDVLQNFYLMEASNVHRGVHTLSANATFKFEESRRKVQSFLGAADEREIIFTRGTTESVNLLASTWGRKNIAKGDEIILSEMEHHSNLVPWQMLAEEKGAALKFIPVTDLGDLDLEAYKNLLNEKTKLVAISHCSNTLGTINPIKEMVNLAHEKGALLFADGAQATPSMPVNVQELGCDFYTFSSHKVFGPHGMGVLYGRYDLLLEMPPYQGGGSMIEEVTLEKTTFNEPPFRFEAGTPHIAGAIGLSAALDYVEGLNREEIFAHESKVLAKATKALKEIEGLRILGESENKASIISFVIDGLHANDIGEILDQQGVAVRTGHHCTQPLMKRFNVTSTVRASFSIYNTEEDVDRLVEAVKKAKELLS